MSFDEWDIIEELIFDNSVNSYSPYQFGQNKKRSKIKRKKTYHMLTRQSEKKKQQKYDQVVEEYTNQHEENNQQQKKNDNQGTTKKIANLSSEKVKNNIQEQIDVNKGFQVTDSKNELPYYPGQSKNVYKNLAKGFGQIADDLYKENKEKFNLSIWKQFFKMIKKNQMNKQLLFAVLNTDVGKQIGTKFFANFQWARIFLGNNSTDVRQYFPFRLYTNKKVLVQQEQPELLQI